MGAFHVSLVLGCSLATCGTRLPSAVVDGARKNPTDTSTRSERRGCGDGVCRPFRGEDFASCPEDCRTLADRVAHFKQVLSESFVVDDGAFKIFEASDCADVPRCFNNNPTSPYGIPLIPLGPGEPDPDPYDVRQIPPGTEHLYGAGRLKPDEAIIWIGTTPPECPYYSFTAYVFSRWNPDAIGGPPYADRITVFASIGDSENQLTLRTSAAEGETSFSKETVIIGASDAGVDRAIREALDESGLENRANTLVLPQFQSDGVTPKLRFGYENEADLIALLMRIADPKAQEPGTPIRDWLDNPGAFVFRIRPKAAIAPEPFPKPEDRPRGTGIAEPDSALDRLVRAIEDTRRLRPLTVQMALPLRFADGDFCLENLFPCFGDCRDTPYMEASFELGRPPEKLIVVGRNHELTKKASYVNITATRKRGSTAYYSVVMSDLAGSAEEFLPRDPGADELWLVKFSRDCRGESFCYEITEEQIPLDEPLVVFVRAYLEPATHTGAKVLPIAESEIEFPKVFKVECRDRQCR